MTQQNPEVPLENRQDPAEPKQVEIEVETSPQPDTPEVHEDHETGGEG